MSIEASASSEAQGSAPSARISSVTSTGRPEFEILRDLVQPSSDADWDREARDCQAVEHLARVVKRYAVVGADGDDIGAGLGRPAHQRLRIARHAAIDDSTPSPSSAFSTTRSLAVLVDIARADAHARGAAPRSRTAARLDRGDPAVRLILQLRQPFGADDSSAAAPFLGIGRACAEGALQALRPNSTQRQHDLRGIGHVDAEVR